MVQLLLPRKLLPQCCFWDQAALDGCHCRSTLWDGNSRLYFNRSHLSIHMSRDTCFSPTHKSQLTFQHEPCEVAATLSFSHAKFLQKKKGSKNSYSYTSKGWRGKIHRIEIDIHIQSNPLKEKAKPIYPTSFKNKMISSAYRDVLFVILFIIKSLLFLLFPKMLLMIQRWVHTTWHIWIILKHHTCILFIYNWLQKFCRHRPVQINYTNS